MTLLPQELLRRNVIPLLPLTNPSFGSQFSKFANRRILLIGDGSHGTSEFYTARAKITQYLVEHHGFNIVAAEADWPDAETIDRYVRRRAGPKSSVGNVKGGGEGEEEKAFRRFPTWMWRNQETHEFVEWLKGYNSSMEEEKRAGFYGLDLYSMGASMQAVIRYLDQVDSEMAKVARMRYGTLQPWIEHPHDYGLAALMGLFKSCEEDVLRMLKDLLNKRLEYASAHEDGDEFHSAEQNARLIADAERYYRSMYYSDTKSWNLRDTHMFETLVRVLKHRGDGSKAIIWAHNSHVGDARATSMGWSRGELNLGQLVKEVFGQEVLCLGCGTYDGTVAAAKDWDAEMQAMDVRPALDDSYEMLAHQTGLDRFWIDLREGECDKELRKDLLKRRLERFIGVIYRPETERYSHYSTAVLPRQFDGYIWFDRTSAVRPLDVQQSKTAVEFDETYPFGL